MPALVIGVVIGVLLTLGVQWAIQRRNKPSSANVLEFPARPPDPVGGGYLDSILAEESDDEALDRLRKSLRVKVFHDETQMDRLIESERLRQPQASMRVLLEAAIERWERDNR